MKRLIIGFAAILFAGSLPAVELPQESPATMTEFMKQFSKEDQEMAKELTTVLAINATVNRFKDKNIKWPERVIRSFSKVLQPGNGK